jgi:hypothetical protein
MLGYGKRYPTERNQMTHPANVPKYRHVPDSEDFIKGCSSTKVIKTDDKALQRNAQAVVFQTSGDYGKHYLGMDPPLLKLQKTGISPAQTVSRQSTWRPENYRAAASDVTARSDVSESLMTDRSSLQSFRDDFNNNQGGSMYAKTLKNLDKTFDRRAKKDLLAATIPTKSAQELVWCATSNDHNAQHTKHWAFYLRKDNS